MKPGRTIRFCLPVVIAIAVTASMSMRAKAASGFPYQKIIDRNAFALRPPPPPAPDPATIKPPPPKITATGIASIFGRKVGLLKVLEPSLPPEPGKPPGPVQEQSYILGEGERQGEVEVLVINELAATIKVNNYGTEMLLTLRTNLPPPVAPAPVPGAPPGVVVQPPVAGMPGAAAPAGITTIGGAAASPSTALKSTIPTRTLRLPTPPTAQPQTPAMSPEEQFIMLHAIQMNDQNMPPPPPVPDMPPIPQ